MDFQSNKYMQMVHEDTRPLAGLVSFTRLYKNFVYAPCCFPGHFFLPWRRDGIAHIGEVTLANRSCLIFASTCISRKLRRFVGSHLFEFRDSIFDQHQTPDLPRV